MGIVPEKKGEFKQPPWFLAEYTSGKGSEGSNRFFSRRVEKISAVISPDGMPRAYEYSKFKRGSFSFDVRRNWESGGPYPS